MFRRLKWSSQSTTGKEFKLLGLPRSLLTYNAFRVHPLGAFFMFTVEHIDPQKGILVSGLDVEANVIIADESYNKRKTNRFVPYRLKDYPAPVNFGETGEFLINGEWVICEFGGEEWWAESTKIGCSQTSSRRNFESTRVFFDGDRWGKETRQKMSESAKKPGAQPPHKKAAQSRAVSETNSKKQPCPQCGMLMNVGNLTKHIKGTRCKGKPQVG